MAVCCKKNTSFVDDLLHVCPTSLSFCLSKLFALPRIARKEGLAPEFGNALF